MEEDTEEAHGLSWATGDTELSDTVIGAAIEVHSILGCGFQERTYQKAMEIELRLRGVSFKAEAKVALHYKAEPIGHGFMDLLVEDQLVVELKAVEHLLDAHRLQVLTYLKAADRRTGLVINFREPRVADGVRRISR